MEEARIDIDDVVAHKLEGWQVKASILLAYGKYNRQYIAHYCGVSTATLSKLEKTPECKAVQAHFRLIEYYHNIREYTEMKKLSIAASNKIYKMQIDNEDYKGLKKSIDQVLALLKHFEGF